MSPAEPGAVLILSTAPAEAAAAIAEALVAERLAACVQCVAVESRYRWRGRVKRAAEHRLEIKTQAALADAAAARLRALHPYDVPELLVLPVPGGGADYLAWIAAETGAPDGGEEA